MSSSNYYTLCFLCLQPLKYTDQKVILNPRFEYSNQECHISCFNNHKDKVMEFHSKNNKDIIESKRSMKFRQTN